MALSKREREIAQLVCEGLSDKEVARQLHISHGTVRIHLHRIYQKLAIEKRAMLARWAFRHLSPAGSMLLFKEFHKLIDHLPQFVLEFSI